MKHKIGIIQGRLSPAIDGKIQAFPWPYWQEEFRTAQQFGFDSIEFIFEAENYQNNPLWTEQGQSEIKQLVKETDVVIDHVCADYFMQQPFMRVSEDKRQASVAVLKELITKCAQIGVKGIEVPLVDNSRMENDADKDLVVKSLLEVLPIAKKFNLEIGLETSLPPQEFKVLLERLSDRLFKANYDTGNSSSLGYDAEEEILTLGPWITNVHIKDRIFGGTTVALGTGDADLDKLFQTFAKVNYAGPFILQAARSQDGDEIKNAKHNFELLGGLISKYLN